MSDPPKIHIADVRRHNLSVYKEIAGHFSKTRSRPWPAVERFLDGELGGGLQNDPGGEYDLVDLGCGNGRHSVDAAEKFGAAVVGMDNSEDMLGEARTAARQAGAAESYSTNRAEIDDIPLPDGSVGCVICVAALHHLPTRGERCRCIREARRVLVSGGRALFSVWSLDAPRFAAVKERQARSGPDVEGGAPGDALVPWTREGDGVVFHRFYHLYREGELESELKEALGEPADECWAEGENIFAVFTGR